MPGSATSPGDFAYDPRLTGRELVAFLAELRGVRALGRARELAERFRADLDRPMGELSRGNRQKIGLVQAASHDPELLILDEPSSGLDPLMQEEFLAFVAEERARGHTVFLSSHELDEVQRACDRVGIIRGGELVAVEDVHEITGRSYRHVTLEFADHVDPGEFRRLNGVSDLESSGQRISFKAYGDVDSVDQGRGPPHPDRHRAQPPDPRGNPPHLLRNGRRPMCVATRTVRSVVPVARAPSAAASLLAIVRRGLRDHRRAPLTWGGSLGAMCALMAAIWPSIEGSINDALESYPEALKDAFNIRLLTTVEQ